MQTVTSTASADLSAGANDNSVPHLPATLPAFPADAVARIERVARGPMTSAPEPQLWRLAFERRSPPFMEPLMGWTGGRDPLCQLELVFPTLEGAVAYARRQGLRYVVRHDARSREANASRARQRREFSDATLGRLGLGRLQESYGEAMARTDAARGAAPLEPGMQLSVLDVVRDRSLSVEEKRAMLMNRAYDAYLVGEWVQLEHVERALELLESAREMPRLDQSQDNRRQTGP